MFAQRQATEREHDSMTRRSLAPVDSPRTRAPPRSRGEEEGAAGRNATQGARQHLTDPEMGRRHTDSRARRNQELESPLQHFTEPEIGRRHTESGAGRVRRNQELGDSRARRNQELESPLPRSLSEVYSSPNHRLRSGDLRRSLNAERLARGVAGGTQVQSGFEQMSQEEFEGQYHQNEGNRRHAHPRAGEYGIFTEQPPRAANPATGQAGAWPEPSAPEFRRFFGGPVPGMMVQQLSHTVSPFTKEIRQAIIPANFKVPSMERYEGKSDPVEHLAAYRGWMEFKGAGDAAMCRAFPLTLGGRARTWFVSLKPGTIGSFAELESCFVAQFLGARPVKKLPLHLSSIIQERKESLKSYVQRFTEVMLEVDGCTDDRAMQAMLNGAYHENFVRAIAVNPPKTFSEMLMEAQKQISADEIIESKRGMNRPVAEIRSDMRNEGEDAHEHPRSSKVSRVRA